MPRPLPVPPVALPMGRTPGEPSLRGLIADAGLFWRAGTLAVAAAPAGGGSPADEYRSLCEFMRLYATLRFYRLALLLGTTGSLVTALTSISVRSQFHRPEMLKLGGLIISLAFLVMELRATSHWVLLRDRCNDLARILLYQPMPTSSRWDPLTTSGARFYLYASVSALWFLSLLLGLDRSL